MQIAQTEPPETVASVAPRKVNLFRIGQSVDEFIIFLNGDCFRILRVAKHPHIRQIEIFHPGICGIVDKLKHEGIVLVHVASMTGECICGAELVFFALRFVVFLTKGKITGAVFKFGFRLRRQPVEDFGEIDFFTLDRLEHRGAENLFGNKISGKGDDQNRRHRNGGGSVTRSCFLSGKHQFCFAPQVLQKAAEPPLSGALQDATLQSPQT